MDKLINSEGAKECHGCGRMAIQNGYTYYSNGYQDICEDCVDLYELDELGERYG